MKPHVRVFLLALPFLALAGPASAKVDIVVDLSTQRLVATRGDGTRVVWPVSTGKSGFETPRGEYQVQRLDLDHHSRKYDDAPMPYAIFFQGGYAIHATFASGLGRPASHGCVRLSLDHAAMLYDWVDIEGAQVSITGTSPSAGRFAPGERAASRRVTRRSRPSLDREDAYFAGDFPAYEGVPMRRHNPPAYAPEEYLSSGE